MQKNITLVLFLFVPVILLCMFVIYPTLKLFQLSLTDWNGTSNTLNYVGIKNYIKLFTQAPEVWLSLKNNAVYFFLHILSIPFSIAFASILNSKLVANRFFKSITLLPYIINGVAIAYMFSFFYSPIDGSFNYILTALGLERFIQNWLSNKDIVNFTLASVSIWRFCGLHTILFLAGITAIPEESFEAAKVDGASAFQTFWYITLPGVKRVLEISLFLNVRGALQVFDIPFLITNGGPGYASSTFTLYTINTAFKFNSFGLASSMGVILIVIIIAISKIQDFLLDSKGL